MRVIATKAGFYGRLLKPGDRFTVERRGHFSPRWMAVEGTKEAKAFLEAFEGAGGDAAPKRDRITGERLLAGGIGEQLAVALEENRVLVARLAALQERLEAIEGSGDRGEEVPAPNPAEPQADAGETSGAEAPPTRVRRRAVTADEE